MNKFNILSYEHIKGRKIVLLESFTYTLKNGEVITVPAGFESDGLSIPRCFRWIVRPFGKGIRAGVIHDYLYSIKTKSRKDSDKILFDALIDCEVSLTLVHSMYIAVRAFGWMFY